MAAHDIQTHPLHLGLGATAIPQPAFTGMEWYGDYVARNGADGAEGRLVSFYQFTENWDSWEKHPAGEEVVICTGGSITLIQEMADGVHAPTILGAGQYAIIPRGCWHTADISSSAAVLFITAGLGTEHRPRADAAS